MTLALVLSVGLVAASGPNDPAPPAPSAYEAARGEAGRDPDAQVKLALWCEAHGLKAERLKHLAEAALIDPRNAAARGLMGLVAFGGQWRRPEDVSAQVKADETLSERLAQYNARRAGLSDTAHAHWKLAVWCDQNGLKPEALAHFTAVTRLDPGREAAWKRLGFKRHHGEWLTDERVAARIAEAEAQRRADRRWGPWLDEARAWRRKGEARAADAETRLQGLSDPRAVPSVWKVFARGEADDQAVATRLFGRIEGPAAARALVQLAVFGKNERVRRGAAEVLEGRDPGEFVDALLQMIQPELYVQVRPAEGPGSVGVLFVASESVELQRNYTTADAPPQARRAGVKTLAPVEGVLQGTGNAAQDRSAAGKAARQLLQQDANQVKAFNRARLDWNDQVLAVLETVTGKDFGPEPVAWKSWWADHEGYVIPTSQYRRTQIQQNVRMSTISQQRPSHRCFAAGTLVRTLDGARAIETLRIGDQVLTQNAETGSLQYEPIVAVFHNPPNQTLRITLEGQDEAIVSTGIHRFWKAGKGWVLARDLKPGDTLRTLGGTARVRTVEPDREQLVFNLEVASGRSYFVGKAGALVHDNTPAQPVLAPFDASPGEPAIARRDR